MIIMFIYYVIYLGLLNVRFLENFIIREVFFSVTVAIISIQRSKYDSQLENADEKKSS